MRCCGKEELWQERWCGQEKIEIEKVWHTASGWAGMFEAISAGAHGKCLRKRPGDRVCSPGNLGCNMGTDCGWFDWFHFSTGANALISIANNASCRATRGEVPSMKSLTGLPEIGRPILPFPNHVLQSPSPIHTASSMPVTASPTPHTPLSHHPHPLAWAVIL